MSKLAVVLKIVNKCSECPFFNKVKDSSFWDMKGEDIYTCLKVKKYFSITNIGADRIYEYAIGIPSWCDLKDLSKEEEKISGMGFMSCI